MELSHSTAVISLWGRGPAMVRKLEVKTHDFVVENYSSIRQGNGVRSGEFVCGGHRWAVVFAPQGDSLANFPMTMRLGRIDDGLTSVSIIRIGDASESLHIMFDIVLLDQSDFSGYKKNLSLSVDLLFTREVWRLYPGITEARCNFASRSLLDSPGSPYVKNGSLKMRIRLGVFSYHARISSAPYIPSRCSRCSDSICEETQFGDEFVFIRVAYRTFCAAKCALAHRCPKLLSYDCHGQLQDIVIPHALGPDIFMFVLGFISRGTVLEDRKAVKFSDPFNLESFLRKAADTTDPLNLESFGAKLLAATTMLELHPLKAMCEQRLSNNISRESVASLLHLAHLCNASHLKSQCLKFQAQHRLVMTKCDKCQLKENCPLLFLEMAQGPFQDNNRSTLKEKGKGFAALKEEVLNAYRTIKFKVGKGFAALKEEVLNAYRTIKFKVGKHWPRFSANKYKQL